MAARKTRGTKEVPWSQQHRDRIRTTMLLNRLEKHILGEVDMSNTQIKAVDILLKKAIPDLSSVALTDAEHTGPAKIEIGWIKD